MESIEFLQIQVLGIRASKFLKLRHRLHPSFKKALHKEEFNT